MRRLCIEISAFLAGPSLAPAVPAIIENENTRPGLEQRGTVFEPMTDVPRVAVAEQMNEVSARRVCVGGKKPAVQSNTIRSLKVKVLKRAAQFAPARLQLAVWLINLAMFKPAQHKINDHQPKEQAGPSAAQTSWLPVGHAQGCHTRRRKASLGYWAGQFPVLLARHRFQAADSQAARNEFA